MKALKFGFLSFSQVWIISFPVNYIGCLTTSRGKTCKKIFEILNMGQMAQARA